MPRIHLTDDELQIISPVLQAYRARKAEVDTWNQALETARSALRGEDPAADKILQDLRRHL